jgi:hypothetical protein
MKNKFFIASIALGMMIGFTSCGSDDGGGKKLPPIGGYDKADDVAKADLVAYFPLDGDGTEDISGTAPSQVTGASWEQGIKGQAAKLNSGWLKYPSIPEVAGITGSISISAWVKITNQKANPDATSAISPIFTLTNPNEQVGNVAFFGNTHGLVSSDSIEMKAEFKVMRPDGSTFGGDAVNMTKMHDWMISDNANGAQHTAAANKIGGQWAHVVFVYEAAGGRTTARIYSNGVKINNTEWENRKIDGQEVEVPFKQFTPTYPIIGALRTVAEGTNTDTWNAALKGSVDEVRVYKKALTQAEIGALYGLEKVGR